MITSPGISVAIAAIALVACGDSALRTEAVEVRDSAGIAIVSDGRWGKVGVDPGGPFLYPLFESFASIAGGGSRVVTGHGSAAELSLYDATGALGLERIVRWTTGSQAISPEDIAAERHRLAEQYVDVDPEMRRRLLDPLLSTDRPVADQFPAFVRTMIGRDGRIWVREYSAQQALEAQHWIAFASSGAFVCRAAVPPVDLVLEFGEDYLLALDRDDLGVERVVQHAVERAVEENPNR